jgi:hypothetical protein
MNPIFTGRIVRGRVALDDAGKYVVYISHLEGKVIELILRIRRSKRSLKQNKFYWAVVIPILADHFGYESQEMHSALKFKFLRTHEKEELVSVRSTTSLNTKEFMDYIERIQRWAATDHQIYIPDPNEIEAREEIG